MSTPQKLIFVVSFLVMAPLPCLGFHNLLINGSTSATLTTEDTLIIDGEFESPGATAELYVLYDWSPAYPLMLRDRAIDGDYDDEDETANGIYHRIIASGFTMTGQFLIIAEDNGVADTALLTIIPISSAYSISGILTAPPNQPHIMVMTYWYDTLTYRNYNYGDFTDNSGNYTISIPNEGGNQWWQMFGYDIVNVAPYYIGGFDSVYVSGNVTKDIAMTPSLPDTCRIYGTIRDEFGNPLPGPSRVTSFAIGSTFQGIRPGLSDNFGAYSIYVPGDVGGAYYTISADIFDQFRPEIMSPASADTSVFGMVPPYQILLDIKVYRATNTITGIVYKDGLPYDDAQLWAENSLIGSATCRSFSDGHYVMPVSDSAGSYDIGVSNESVPQGYYVVEGSQTVPPGATNIDFHLIPLAVSENMNSSIKADQLVVYPNPSKRVLCISYIVDRDSVALYGRNSRGQAPTLRIYDASGRLVRQWDYKTMRLSDNVVWDGSDDIGHKLPAGVYFVRLEAGDYKQVVKAILLR